MIYNTIDIVASLFSKDRSRLTFEGLAETVFYVLDSILEQITIIKKK